MYSDRTIIHHIDVKVASGELVSMDIVEEPVVAVVDSSKGNDRLNAIALILPVVLGMLSYWS